MTAFDYATPDGGRTDGAATAAAPTTNAPASSRTSNSGAYVPRWKRDASVKPEPYRASSSGKALRPGPGKYTSVQISKKLGAAIKHSFLVSYVGYYTTPASPTVGEASLAPQSSPNCPASKEVLRAVLNYPGANPPSTEPGTHIIWTRHNVECIKQNIGQAIPFFHCRSPNVPRSSNESRIYTYEAYYRIESAESATKEEVLEFVKARDQSKGEKLASVWLDKLNSHWLKVLLSKCPDYEQKGNPMES